MKNLYKKITFFLFVSLLFFGCFCHFAYALEIKTYPNVPGLPSLTDKSDLTDYVAYFFGLIVYTAGAIATISFAIGAIQMIASAANPSMATEGKERMKGAVLGLILTLSAFVILKTINPSLVNQTLTPLPGVDGIFYQSGSNLKTAPQSESDTSNIPSGYNTIFYKCSNKDIAPALLVWLFVNKGQDPAGGVNVKRIECGGSVGVSGGSFQMAFETAGVYFCTGSCNTSGTVCSGYMSGANTYSQDEIDSAFRGNIKSIRIVQDKKDEDNPVYYGALVHQEPYLKNGGVCQAVTLNTETSCFSVTIPAFAIDIFQWNKNNPNSSGSGVAFYSGDFGWNTNVEITSGKYNIDENKIKEADGKVSISASSMIFDFSKTKDAASLYCDGEYPSCNSKKDNEQDDVENGYCCNCKTAEDCLGSIQINGHYLVTLWSAGNWCKSFIENVKTIKEFTYVKTGSKLSGIDIIPTK